MKTAFLLSAFLAVLASRQDPPKETAADLDKRATDSLQRKVPVVKGLTLPMLFFMNKELHDVRCYADPVAITKLDDIKTAFEGEVSLNEVLQKTLKAKGLLHLVWQGIVVLTDEKGRKAFEQTDWTGLTEKALQDHPDLAKKLDTPLTVEWDVYKPQDSLKALSAWRVRRG